MQKHIIAISSSPSQGRNSDTLLDSFIEGINLEQHISTEKIYLSEIFMHFYRYENRLGPEPDEKDFKKLCEKIECADGLVIATPTYNFSVPAHLKNFIDRIRFIALDFDQKNRLGQPIGKLQNLCTYFIVTGGTPSWAQKILFFAFPPFWLRGVFLYYGAHVLGGLYTGNTKAFEDTRLRGITKKKGLLFAKQVKNGVKNGIIERIFWRPPQHEH